MELRTRSDPRANGRQAYIVKRAPNDISLAELLRIGDVVGRLASATPSRRPPRGPKATLLICRGVASYLQPGRIALRCDTRHTSYQRHASVEESATSDKPTTLKSPTDADFGRTSCASRPAASVRAMVDPTEGRGPSPYSPALATAERVAPLAPDAPLPPPPPSPPPPPALAFPLPLALLAGASVEVALLLATPPPKRLLQFLAHCRHSPSRTSVVVMGARRSCCSTSVLRRPPRLT